MMDTGEVTCCGEGCVLCKTDESQTSTSETNNAPYVNELNLNKFFKNKGNNQKRASV